MEQHGPVLVDQAGADLADVVGLDVEPLCRDLAAELAGCGWVSTWVLSCRVVSRREGAGDWAELRSESKGKGRSGQVVWQTCLGEGGGGEGGRGEEPLWPTADSRRRVPRAKNMCQVSPGPDEVVALLVCGPKTCWKYPSWLERFHVRLRLVRRSGPTPPSGDPLRQSATGLVVPEC